MVISLILLLESTCKKKIYMSFSMVRNGEFCSQIQGDPDDADHDQRMAVPLRVLSGACLDQNFWKKNPAGTQSHGEKMVKKDNFPF